MTDLESHRNHEHNKWYASVVQRYQDQAINGQVDPSAWRDLKTKDVKELIDSGVDVNARNHLGHTPLVHVLRHTLNDKIVLLLKSGASVKSRDHHGETPLMKYIDIHASIELIDVLIEAGSDVNAKSDSGGTPLIHVVGGGSIFDASRIQDDSYVSNAMKTVRSLINAGADVNAQTECGKTALMVAALRKFQMFARDSEMDMYLNEEEREAQRSVDLGNYGRGERNMNKFVQEVIPLLIESGADGLIKNSEGKKAIDFAKENEGLIETEAYWALMDVSF